MRKITITLMLLFSLGSLAACARNKEYAPIEYHSSASRKSEAPQGKIVKRNIAQNKVIKNSVRARREEELIIPSEATKPVVEDDGEIISIEDIKESDAQIIQPQTTKPDAYGLEEPRYLQEREYDGKKSQFNKNNDDQNSASALVEEPILSKNDKIIYHKVEADESIEDIADRYNQTAAAIAKLNNIPKPYYIEEGYKLKIKIKKNQNTTLNQSSENHNFVEPVTLSENELDSELASLELTNSAPKNNSDNALDKISIPYDGDSELNPDQEDSHLTLKQEYILPLKGTIAARFGDKTPIGINKGITIAANKGAKVVATAGGTVIYADYDAIFGNLVIIKLHNKNIITSYAHLDKLMIAKGASVKQGDIIGYVGASGKASSPQLHFAIREGKSAKDPAQFIDITSLPVDIKPQTSNANSSKPSVSKKQNEINKAPQKAVQSQKKKTQ